MSRFARFNLFVAFAFTVMADPVSSIAYAIEAALSALGDDLASLVPTMALVVGTICVVAGTYHQLIRRFPAGGGGPEGVAAAFGEGWAFLPLGALLVDFTLTIAVSSAAGASALIAYAPELDDLRLPLAAGLALLVGVSSLAGHRSRVVFATATLAFLGLALAVVFRGALADPAGAESVVAGASFLPVLLALPLGMALATGLEAPSNAIAELSGLGDRERRLFGQATVWIMLAIVGSLTLAFALLAVRLGIGLPEEGSTLLADVARRATSGDAVFVAFQVASTLLLLAACASSYIAGSGLLAALARHRGARGGLLPARFGEANRFYVPTWGVGAVGAAALGVVVATGGRDQEVVKFYAAAVFLSFLAAVVACAVLSWRDRRLWAFAANVAGVGLVALVLALNLRRLDPLVTMGAAGLLALYFRWMWVRRGRPTGVGRLGRE